uniref:Uncharacterized protein n=1 Tax=Rhizophora mucronata TaxID=61149 RepID=A0A2P2NZ40_RHIMU
MPDPASLEIEFSAADCINLPTFSNWISVYCVWFSAFHAKCIHF